MIFRRLAHWHEDTWLLDRLATPAGQIALLLLTALLLPEAQRLPVTAALALSMLAPGYRVQILAAASLWVLYHWLPKPVRLAGPAAWAVGGACVLTLFFACLAAARRFSALPALVRQFPVATVHVLLLGLMAACSYAAGRAGNGLAAMAPASLAALIPLVIWRSSYLMLSGRRGTLAGTPFTIHLAYWLPLWGGSSTPYGKGYDYLRQHEAKDAAALARSRAAGLKLLVLALAWTLLNRRLELPGGGGGLNLPGVLGGWSMSLPDLATVISEGPAAHGLVIRWCAVALHFLRNVLELAAAGHLIVGVLRLFGFNVFRNTYKPLLATTVVEFWNRYYYYFKELLVEFFFYPTFLALTRCPPAARILLSVLAAATLGNLYFHVLRDYHGVLAGSSHQALLWLGNRFLYCLILGLGIALSMLRERRARGRPGNGVAGGPWTRWRSILGVWLFYMLLQVWSVAPATLGLNPRLAYLGSLVGL